MLKINDLFWTIQGEGFHAGTRALFVRMPFCNLQCPWCDTSFNSFKEWAKEDFVKFANSERARFAVLTGGEPTKNKQLPEVIEILKSLNFYIAVESNGHYPIPKGIDWVTISPKMFHVKQFYVHPETFLLADEFKYVVDDNFDFEILKKHELGNQSPRLSLSPEYGNFQKNVQKILDYIKEHPQWKISLQTHKWMGIA